MRDWDSYYKHLNLAVEAASDLNTFSCSLIETEDLLDDPLQQRTLRLFQDVCALYDDLPRRIAADIHDPLTRWEWARRLYWGKGSPAKEIAKHLLNCAVDDVAAFIGPSEKALTCAKCHRVFHPESRKDWKDAFIRGFKTDLGGPICAQCE